ncbi:hypothetical protein CDAR_398531 [Caerostris darwini]|uniref:Uncharacterized protein n=1 Tax=Caerostris darwini TaxID=1538125 RepID=A0AAV4VDN1_9ARAC|nr:hypothetical protein CDAR_398531 [Caerostris darwini]
MSGENRRNGMMLQVQICLQVAIQDASGSGRPSTSNTDNNKRPVDIEIRAESRISIRALSKHFDICFGSEQHIIQQELGYCKVCSQWIQLNFEQKLNWMAVSLNWLHK